MKWKCVFANVVMLGLLSTKLLAQNENYSFILPSNLTITCNKTTNLIFPANVQSVDRGSKDILVQQPKGVENVVQIKADKPNFSQTNLSVITVDGSLYSFTIDYAAQPVQLNVVVKNNSQITGDSPKTQTIKLSSDNNEALFKAIAQRIDASKPVLNKRISLNQMQLRVRGVYINNDVIYFRLHVKNKSNLSFDIDNVRFSIKDREQSRRTATQEIQLMPVYSYQALNKIKAGSIANNVIAIPKFTLTGSKYLQIDVLEKDGNRNLKMLVTGHYLERATTITE